MRDVVLGMTRFRYLFGINPMGVEVSRKKFDEFMLNFPHATRRNYSDADVYVNLWMGKEKWIAMYHLVNKKYYVIDEA